LPGLLLALVLAQVLAKPESVQELALGLAMRVWVQELALELASQELELVWEAPHSRLTHMSLDCWGWVGRQQNGHTESSPCLGSSLPHTQNLCG